MKRKHRIILYSVVFVILAVLILAYVENTFQVKLKPLFWIIIAINLGITSHYLSKEKENY